MEHNRRGVIAAGNWIVDHVKIIDAYPQQDGLADIQSESANNGGSPFNVLKDLARLGAPFPLQAVGLVGEDDNGRWIRTQCMQNNINADALKTTAKAATSYTDVMSVAGTGRRTFFHQRGANALLDESYFDFTACREKIFHLGYLLLLDALDVIGEDGQTGAARVLAKARDAGMTTCVDLVSSSSPDFQKIVRPSLPFIDYLFLNEVEAQRCTGATIAAATMDTGAMEKAADALLQSGVRQWVILHWPAGVFAKHVDGRILRQGALDMPQEKIVSTVGAGDALLAGTLFGLHEEWPMQETLRLGICAAAASLTSASCSDGVATVEDCLKLAENLSFREI